MRVWGVMCVCVCASVSTKRERERSWVLIWERPNIVPRRLFSGILGSGSVTATLGYFRLPIQHFNREDLERAQSMGGKKSTQPGAVPKQPGTATRAGKEPPAVLLLGWAGCKPNHLQKYCGMYEQLGCVRTQLPRSNRWCLGALVR